MSETTLTPAARRKGGRATRLRPRTVDASDLPGELLTLEDCQRWSAWTTRAIASGEVDRATGATILKGVSLQQLVVGKLHLETELRELRALVKRLQEAKQ
jgi:hypothetical protein